MGGKKSFLRFTVTLYYERGFICNLLVTQHRARLIRCKGSRRTCRIYVLSWYSRQFYYSSFLNSFLKKYCRVYSFYTYAGFFVYVVLLSATTILTTVCSFQMIQKEGIETLTLSELQQACRFRGMRAYGLSPERLRFQLAQWLDLSLNKKVPPSLLLLSRAFMLPETIPTTDKLKATISALPETVVRKRFSVGQSYSGFYVFVTLAK